MAELVDAIDSKSIFRNGVPVQVRIQAPNCYKTQAFRDNIKTTLNLI